MTIYICLDNENCGATGKSLTESWKHYENENGSYGLEELKFYKAEEVEIEINEKPVIVKTPVAKKPVKK